MLPRMRTVDKAVANATETLAGRAEKLGQELLGQAATTAEDLTAIVVDEVRQFRDELTMVLAVIGGLAVSALVIACLADIRAARRG